MPQDADRSPRQQHCRLLDGRESATRHGERERMLAELHDTVKPSIYNTILLLSLCGRELRRRNLDVAEDLLDRALAESREASYQISRPLAELRGMLTDGTEELVAVLDAHLDRLRTCYGLTIEVDLTASLPALDPQQRSAMFRTVTEALWNVARHAAADRAWVRTSVQGTAVVMEIGDDGRGFAPGLTPVGVGLRLMRERAEACGGRLSVQSAPGQGTRIALRFDLP